MAVIVPIAAEFDASGVKRAQASFAQFGQTLTKTLQQAGKDARKAFGDIEDGAKDSSTAAQRLALAITQSADKLDTELKQSKAAADALAKALGPDFVAKAGAGGINKLVVDLNRAGVSIQEITAEADVLAAAIKKVDDVNLSSVSAETDKLNAKLNTTANNADRSRGVMANFVGNAAQEIPGLTNAMGPLNVAVGQFAEYATEGGISLKNLGKSLGPIVVISTALGVVKGVLKANAEQAQLFKDNVVLVRDALLDLEDPVKAIALKNKEALEIKVFDPNKGVFGGTREITKDVDKLGLTQQDLTRIIKGGKSAVEEWADTVEGSRKPLRRWALDRDEATSAALVYKYLNDQLKTNAKGATDAAAAERVFGDTLQYTQSSMNTVTIAAGAAAVAIEQKTKADEAAAAAAEAAAQADRNQAAGIDAVREALYKRNNARYASVDADLSAKAAIEEYNKAQAKADKTGKAADIEKANALQREAEKALNNAAAAASNYAGEIRSYASETERANAANAAGADELNNLKNLLGKGSELVRTVEAWVLLLKQVPASIVTKFGISFGSSIAAPLPSVGTGMPGVSSSVIEGWQSTFNNSAGTTNVTNITVNGATNSQETANLIATNQARSNQRQGTS